MNKFKAFLEDLQRLIADHEGCDEDNFEGCGFYEDVKDLVEEYHIV